MKNKHLPAFILSLLFLMLSVFSKAQAPVANFTVSPTPICTGSANVIQINDLSTNAPTSWSYTIALGGGPGPGGSTTLAVQNPTMSFNNPGTYSITLISTNSSGASSAVTHTVRVYPSPNANINPAAPTICPGAAPITLNIPTAGPNATNTYSWSTSATTSSITVSPTVTTTYSCLITSTNGCSVTRISTVTVSQPTVTLTSVPASICPGSSSTITAAASGTGTWNYLWSTGATSSNISTTVAGVYTATVSNTNGCLSTATYSLGTSSTLSLTATASQTAVCSGSTAILSVSGANTYTWSTGSNLISIFVTPTVTTTYTVLGEFGACSGTTSVLLTVSKVPTITTLTSENSTCAGNTVTLTATGATTYTWLPGSVLSQTATVTPTVNTTYTVRGNNPGCPNSGTTITVVVFPKPVIQVSSSSPLSCAGDAVALAASGASTYTWSNGATTGVILVTPMVTSTYTVAAIDFHFCTNQAVITQNVTDCTGIEHIAAGSQQTAVYPNPSTGEFVLNLESASDVLIYNALGKLVYSQKNLSGKQNIDLSTEANGIYFVKVLASDKQQTLRLVKH